MDNPFTRIPPRAEDSLAELYHENTKYHPYLRSVEDAPPEDETFPPLEPLLYGSQRIPLPQFVPLAARLDVTMLRRRSRRDFTGEALPLADLSRLLMLSYGVTSPEGERAAPSAGARYPLELYPLVLRVEDLMPGLYHYQPVGHELEPVEPGLLFEPLRRWFFGQDFLQQASVVILVGAVFSRTTVKYKERGYRLLLLDAGHAMQNLMLTATASDLGAVGLGGFLDDELNALARLDGADENILYAVAVGKTPITAEERDFV